MSDRYEQPGYTAARPSGSPLRTALLIALVAFVGGAALVHLGADPLGAGTPSDPAADRPVDGRGSKPRSVRAVGHA